MDIVRQILLLLWVLGIVLVTPPILRHFNVDVQTAYRKVLFLDEKSSAPARDALAVQKHEIKQEVFDELFKDVPQEDEESVAPTEPVATEKEPTTPTETSAARELVKQKFEDMIVGLKDIQRKVSAIDNSTQMVQEVPSPFVHEKGAENKVRWLPPPPGFMTGETFNYLIYRQQQPVNEKLKTVLDDIHGNLMLDLTPFTLVTKPNKILVMLFENRKSYMEYTNRPAWSGAASDLRADTMYVLEGPNFFPLSVHELTHLYFDGYFLPSISPLWLSEGMAVYMQIYATRRKPSWLEPGIQRILSGQYINLEQMMEMEDLASLSTGQAELWYTQAYSVVSYLLNNRSRDEFYRFCNELKAGTPTYLALYRAYGMPFTKISALQNVWLYDLARKVGKEKGNAHANVSAQVLSSTQTIRVPVQQSTQRVATPQTQPAQRPAQAPQRTVIHKLQMVETNGYKGNF